MNHDPTEEIRTQQARELNANPGGRGTLEAKHGQVWDTAELSRDFDVLGFLAPCAVVRRKIDGKKGSLIFQHEPRFYFGWQEDR